MLHRPLERLAQPAERTAAEHPAGEVLGASQLHPRCADLYRCLSTAESCVAAPTAERPLAPPPDAAPRRAGWRGRLTTGLSEPETQAGGATAAATALETIGDALCSRGDLGPFPCLEEGCYAVAIPCSDLAESSCDARFAEVWAAPQSWLRDMRVWEACPVACGMCSRRAVAAGEPRITGSCDA